MKCKYSFTRHFYIIYQHTTLREYFKSRRKYANIILKEITFIIKIRCIYIIPTVFNQFNRMHILIIVLVVFRLPCCRSTFLYYLFICNEIVCFLKPHLIDLFVERAGFAILAFDVHLTFILLTVTLVYFFVAAAVNSIFSFRRKFPI